MVSDAVLRVVVRSYLLTPVHSGHLRFALRLLLLIGPLVLNLKHPLLQYLRGTLLIGLL
jgi:hypothetical protein